MYISVNGVKISAFPRILVKIIESLEGIKLALKTLKYEMLLLFDDGVVLVAVAIIIIIISPFLRCYQCSRCEKRIVCVKTIGKSN